MFEEDEPSDKDDGAEISGVRRMANAYEARDSASEASEDEHDQDKVTRRESGRPLLRSQWTGGSESWKRWKGRRESGGTMADVEDSPLMDRGKLSASSEEPEERLVTPLLDVLDKEPVEVEGSSPPLLFPAPDSTKPLQSTPLNQHPHLRDRSSVTPTPERIVNQPSTSGLGFSPGEEEGEDDSPPSSSPHMSNMSKHKIGGINPYAALRRTSSSGSRIPSIKSIPSTDQDTITSTNTNKDNNNSNRRITLRPTPISASSVFAPTAWEKELENQLSTLIERVRDLEERLGEKSRPATPDSSISGVLDKFFGTGGDDGLPRRVSELPGYLFLVGVGVGAVMVRVLLGRR